MPPESDVHRICLIAETDPFIASLLVRFAEGSGLECVRARASDDVRELARRLNPHVIIIDAELPGDIIGWEIMRALKQDKATCQIALISCSWLSEPEVRSLVGGLAGHLQKPDFAYNDFERVLRAASVLAADRQEAGLSSSRSGKPQTPDRFSDIRRDNVSHSQTAASRWNIELESKPDFAQAIDRIYAWYEQQIIDRPPVRFTRHNAEYETVDHTSKESWRSLKDKWFDEEYQIESFLNQLRGKRYLGETFPVYWPNLGPNVFAALYGTPLEFSDVTSWAMPILSDYDQTVALDWQSEYLRKLESLTRCALAACPGKFMVGYTDLHSGLDWLAALRGTEALLLDMIDRPDRLKPLLQICTPDFLALFDHFDAMLKATGQPSITWMGIPSFGKMHIPSCDFAAMISPRHFKQFALPALLDEVQHMTHNIFHVDGKGVARHLDLILQLPNVQAIQWVQGVGDDLPIMQWVPLIQRIQAAGKSVVVDLSPAELEDFIGAVRPEGIFLTMASEDEAEEQAILKRIARW